MGISHGNLVAGVHKAGGDVVVVHARGGGIDAGKPVAAGALVVVGASAGATGRKARAGATEGKPVGGLRRDAGTFTAVPTIVALDHRTKQDEKHPDRRGRREWVRDKRGVG